MPTPPYPTHKKKQLRTHLPGTRHKTWSKCLNLPNGGCQLGYHREDQTRAAPELKPRALQLALESHNTPAQAASNIYHLQLRLGRMGSAQHRSANRGKQQTEVQFARRHLSPTPQFSPSLPLPVWEATAQFFPEEPPSSIHLSLQKLQLPHQTPTPGYKNHCPLS